jgi:serine/threonine-protein kinase
MRYRLIERIGSGGMAEVFRAVAEGPEGFERTFVVKRILPRLASSREFVRMFVDEAKISARLNHPNIVQVFEFAASGDFFFLAMEHVDGRDLGTVIKALADRHLAPPPNFAAEVARQCCLGLEHAHRLAGPDGKPLGIVHRDVTPSNIMISFDGTVKLLDFGIARAIQELRTTETQAGMMKGKMSYIAPEQVLKGEVDARSDVFSLGVVLHEALTARRLFLGENDLHTLKMILEAPIPPPSRQNPAVKRSLDRIVMRALRRDPQERYASAAEMADDIEAYLRRERYAGRGLARLMDDLYGDERKTPRVESAPTAAAANVWGEQKPEGTIVLDLPPQVVDAGATPPPLPGTTARRVPADSIRALVVGAPPPAPGHGRPKSLALAVTPGFAVALTLVLYLVATRTQVPAPANANANAKPKPNVARETMAVGSPAIAAPPLPAPPAPAAVVPTVEISLDSMPQGASVSTGPASPPLGETPIILQMPRSRQVVELVLRKDGYTTTVFKVIPNQDKPAVARLKKSPSASSAWAGRGPLAAAAK